ncbi:unnamed protein product [Prunus armeniaca]
MSPSQILVYGLKQASHQWFSKFTEAIQATSFTQSKADYSLFTRKNDKSFTALLIYIDDIMIIGNNFSAINALKQFLNTRIEVSRSKKDISICQRKYALDIIKDGGALGARPVRYFMIQQSIEGWWDI